MTNEAGQVVLLRFPHANLANGKLRPVWLVAQVPGRHGDWLVSMITSQLHQAVSGFDDTLSTTDDDFQRSPA